MRFLCLSLFALLLFTFAGCASAPPTEEISEVSLKGQTGLLGVAFTIAFRRDGTALCNCSFYRLDKNNKPNIGYTEPFCKELYVNNPAAFVESKNTYGDFHLEGNFVGNITDEQFEQLAHLVDKNGFFSMSEKYVELAMDAPPDFTKVVYSSGKTKEVSDNLDNGGEKLSEIKRAIYNRAKEMKWEKAQK
jgi:hypothetical protein